MKRIKEILVATSLIIQSVTFGQMTYKDSLLQNTIYNYCLNVDQNLKFYKEHYSNGQSFLAFNSDSILKTDSYILYFYSGGIAKKATEYYSESGKKSAQIPINDHLPIADSANSNIPLLEEVNTFYLNQSIRSIELKDKNNTIRLFFNEKKACVYQEIIVFKDTVSGIFFKPICSSEYREGQPAVYFVYEQNKLNYLIYAEMFSNQIQQVIDYTSKKKIHRKRKLNELENMLLFAIQKNW